ncbi:MAG: hypothetical protein E7277_07650 [Lachnospiraceae bacterium]|nr:hypothetical protein [Lachnospiraceae bacterium]
MHLVKKYLPPVVVVVILAVFFLLSSGRFQKDFIVIRHEDGFADIRNYDFDGNVYHLVNNWDYFPGKLYTPKDFADEKKRRSRIITQREMSD